MQNEQDGKSFPDERSSAPLEPRPDDEKCAEEGDPKGGTPFPKPIVQPQRKIRRTMSAREMVFRNHKVYASVDEVNSAVKTGTFDPSRTTAIVNGRLYFLCYE